MIHPHHETPGMIERLEALRAGLAEAGTDAFFSVSPAANQYLTGFMGSTSAVVVTGGEAQFLCDFRYTEQAEDEVREYAVEEVKGDLVARVGERLDHLGAQTVVFDPACVTVAQSEAIQGSYKGALKPLPDLVASLRVIKSAYEVERIRAASELAEGVLADFLGGRAEGVVERDLAAWFEYEFKKRGASGASFDTIALFGPRSSLPHGMPGATPLRSGDIVLLDLGCRLAGYCSDLTRTYAYATIPGAWFEEVYGVVLAAQQAALAAVRPGVSCGDVDAVARAMIAEAGYGSRFGHGLGHGVGIEVHEAPRLNADAETILQDGMVITIEPGIYLPGCGGVRIEDLIVVTKDGCEVLSRASKELKVLEK